MDQRRNSNYVITQTGAPRVTFEIVHPDGTRGYALLRPGLKASAGFYSRSLAECLERIDCNRFGFLTAFFPDGERASTYESGASIELLHRVAGTSIELGMPTLYCTAASSALRQFLSAHEFKSVERVESNAQSISHHVADAQVILRGRRG